jgi:hypothetical protein
MEWTECVLRVARGVAAFLRQVQKTMFASVRIGMHEVLRELRAPHGEWVDTILGRVARQYASKDAAVVTARTVSAWLLPLHAWKQARLRETLAADFTDL